MCNFCKRLKACRVSRPWLVGKMGDEVTVELVDAAGNVCQTGGFDLFEGHLQLTGSGGLLDFFKARTIKRHKGAAISEGENGLTRQYFRTGLLQIEVVAPETGKPLLWHLVKLAAGQLVLNLAQTLFSTVSLVWWQHRHLISCFRTDTRN